MTAKFPGLYNDTVNCEYWYNIEAFSEERNVLMWKLC